MMRAWMAGLGLAVAVAQPLEGQWKASVSKDEMTGKKRCYAMSADVTKRVGGLYGAVEGTLAVGMDGSSEWVYGVAPL